MCRRTTASPKAPDLLPLRRSLLLLIPGLLTGCAATPDTVPPPSPTESTLVCDRDYVPAIRELVRGAQSEVLVAQWELHPSGTTSDIEDLLVEAVDAGVEVRLLLDDEVDENVDAVARLRARGVDARLDTRAKTRVHAKVLVADGRDALVGSTNWSSAAIDFNHECNLRLRDGGGPTYVGDWLRGVIDGETGRTPPDVSQDGPAIALVDDDLLPSLLERMGAAERRIDFVLYATYLQPTNPSAPSMQVFQALVDAQTRGVTVRGVADWSDWNEGNNKRNADAVDWLTERGVSMRWEDPRINTHAKTFLIDDVLQVQSANISTSGLAQSREVGAVTPEAAPIEAYEVWFEALWDDSTEEPES
jgi:phosphatidylserine/phosphatidylglycerophosphate/cardiolipin synthase-like enzyme